MTSIFISHASPDRAFALRLAGSLEKLGYTAWVDAREIRVGDAIPQRVAEAVERADYLVVVLSRHSAASSWSEHEWSTKYWEEVARRRPCVLPAVLEECAIPFFLRPKRYADFRSEYAVGLTQLAVALDAGTRAATMQDCSCHGNAQNEVERCLSLQQGLSPAPQFCYAAGTMHKIGRLVEVNVELEIPYLGKVAGLWKPDEREQDAAWELYVELATRIAVAELAPGDGLLRESLSSLHGMFTTTRQLLRAYGPGVARPKDGSELSFGYLAISMLNYVLRPVLAKWHPLLLDYEHQKAASVSALQHEAGWERAEELRTVLNETRYTLMDYAELLAQISRVPTARLQRASLE